jgi:hypothetical protein
MPEEKHRGYRTDDQKQTAWLRRLKRETEEYDMENGRDRTLLY